MIFRGVVLFILSILLGACTKKSGSEVGSLSAEALVSRGQAVYVSNCISCHNIDPKKDGAIGPAVWGSSLELLDARILRAAYPPGYKAKRDSVQMPALVHLGKETPALHAYLNQ